MEFKDDPINKMSVEEYDDMLIREKQDALKGAREDMYLLHEHIAEIEKELLELIEGKIKRTLLKSDPPLQGGVR